MESKTQCNTWWDATCTVHTMRCLNKMTEALSLPQHLPYMKHKYPWEPQHLVIHLSLPGSPNVCLFRLVNCPPIQFYKYLEEQWRISCSQYFFMIRNCTSLAISCHSLIISEIAASTKLWKSYLNPTYNQSSLETSAKRHQPSLLITSLAISTSLTFITS